MSRRWVITVPFFGGDQRTPGLSNDARVAGEELMKGRGPFGRSLNAFHTGPVTVRNALRVIVAATVTTTAAGGLLVWTFDRKDFSNLGDAMWWSLQTVTTVGYGDVTPTNTAGR